MVVFVIVDDDIKIQNKIKELIVNKYFSTKVNFDIKIFDKYTNELQGVINDETTSKIYILDIDLKDAVSGISIAETIRACDWDSEIIFITNHSKMFYTVYKTVFNVFSFIEKFHNFEKRLSKDIAKIINHKNDNGRLNFSLNNTSLSLKYSDISYIYRDTSSRKIIIVTSNNQYMIPLSLKEVSNLLDNRFVKVHRACLVNKDRIEKYDWRNKSFVTDQGNTVNLLSSKYKADVKT